jgi:hypothetical protein
MNNYNNINNNNNNPNFLNNNNNNNNNNRRTISSIEGMPFDIITKENIFDMRFIDAIEKEL